MGDSKRTFSGVIGGLAGFVAMSAVAGLLITVGITPALAISSLAASSTINAFENLPNYLKIDELSQVSTIYAVPNSGVPYELASFYDQNRVEVPLAAMNLFVQDAVVAGEDPRFREHGGIDLQGTMRAALAKFTGGPTSGGSSVTQQYVKNVLVQKCEVMPDPDELQACFEEATDPTEERKLKEMRLAIGVEKEYSKDEILQGYLNITGFGGTVYGIQAAAEYYFSATAATLTLPQAASLIAIVNNPEKFRLDEPESETNGAANGYAANKDRRDYILREMLKHKKINQADYDTAVASPIEPAITEPSTGCQTAGGAAYFCDYVTYQLKTDPTFGADEDTRMTNFRRGGYQIYTTLDIELQMASEAAIAENVPMTYDGWDVGAVATSVEVGTGRVLTMAQNKLYTQLEVAPGPEYTGINYNTDFNQGGSLGFQPGSTYKVFTLAEWLKEGHPLGERVDSARKSNWGTFQDYCDGAQSFPGYNPRNDSNEAGRNYSALESTIDSINTGFLGMAKRLDLCKIRDMATSFGVHRADGDPLQKGAGSVLGTNEVAPLSMAVAFAGIANKGITCSPIVIDRIIGADGVEIPAPVSTCTASVEPEVAAGMAYAMERVMTQGSAGQSYRNTSPRVDMIGKTGTTDGSNDTWMSGASTEVATVVGVVSVTGKDNNQRNLDFDSGSAATARHRIWPEIMGVANAKYGGEEFEQAANNLIRGVQVTVPDVRGMSVDAARDAIEGAGFGFLDGGVTDSELPAGTVSRSDPAGGASTSTGATVTVFSSNGSQILLPNVVGQSLDQAKGTLSGFGVVASEQPVTDASQNGKVLSMTPAAGTPTAPGGTVTVVVGKSAPPG
ncbi:penicillin-binding protein [Cryobacterium sp. LW097]|uniref:transglycosylase domain-containing protein n=1 Tax=unclassified Cryobacterium TaxID=2649013 RepID=UPI000B4C481C|nr:MULTISPECIES: transglycosylase domain-containing protein [unclassified Cryobacterium]ASD21099.1 penicillin-binding protein [Cryobacterium sp. LW097]TFC55094.1 PASTA domain-containing protein [Cryobacterium sp. TMB3-1-2]TFC61627.1 PASTA domain-containing protein [Cryobacterium sp. TMB1-7]TFC67178.1 PASTA domain-containing protein [Cryobacterium sp. TMB3-15]TFC73309.1 PASTA domain-containing protein [Cryobacterium sp. TMB3-10]